MTFTDFFKDVDFLKSIVSIIIAREAKYLTDSLLNDIIMPVINRDVNNDGIDDIDVLKNYKIKVLGAEIKIGNFLITIIKHIIIISIIYLIYKIGLSSSKL